MLKKPFLFKFRDCMAAKLTIQGCGASDDEYLLYHKLANNIISKLNQNQLHLEAKTYVCAKVAEPGNNVVRFIYLFEG